MRKILSKEEKQKKQQRNQFIVGGILIAVMLFSTAGYAFYGGLNDDAGNSGKKMQYNGYEFINNGNLWILNLGESQFGFINNPNEINSLNIETIGLLKELYNYQDKVLYIDSNDNEASSEIYINLVNNVQRIQQACLNETLCKDKNFPIKDCSNNLIIIKESNNSKIEQNKNCVFISGKKSEIIKITDSFLLDIIGVK